MSFIDLNEINLEIITSSLVLFGFAGVMLLVSAFIKNLNARFFVPFSILGIILANNLYPLAGSGFYGLFNQDGFSIIAKSIIMLASILYLLLFLRLDDKKPGEFYALFLFMVGALLFMVSSFNLIFIFIALETSSLALYSLIAISSNIKATEAAIKYFSLGALSAGLFTFGAAMLYLASGSLDIATISQNISQNDLSKNMIVLLGASFLIAAMGFKLSLVPFHTWVRDVYEGASLELAGFISVVPKVAASVVAIRVFKLLNDAGVSYISLALSVLAIATMSVANIAALASKDLRSMLSYSSVSHAGFILVGVLIGSADSITALFFYWTILLFANLGAFGLLSAVKIDEGERYTHTADKFNGAIKTNPAFALCFGLFAFTLAGIPPLGLFWAKALLISTAISHSELALGIIMIINSAIAVAYYLKPVVAMFLKPNEKAIEISLSLAQKISIGVACIMVACGLAFTDGILTVFNFIITSTEVFEF
ncbi:NADH-quinone oxidoreductase subunit N [Campylobacter sp. 19-13652]|uniref:NADH-quinone oxidoreductase subunit N n=1 Tax=Campylobacter sp. 19-13652 TaxID=2840180 RepID=UPI001C749A4C|nr:NADH-quinone oxidoreductase subunit N [Campylobacter sp. 19-13652]BCX78744.1 NADH-quinone oxidoreductase subunit N [Campylobacter sp. 19-13652]